MVAVGSLRKEVECMFFFIGPSSSVRNCYFGAPRTHNFNLISRGESCKSKSSWRFKLRFAYFRHVAKPP